MEEWRLVFWITVAVLVATNVIFVVLGSGKSNTGMSQSVK